MPYNPGHPGILAEEPDIFYAQCFFFLFLLWIWKISCTSVMTKPFDCIDVDSPGLHKSDIQIHVIFLWSEGCIFASDIIRKLLNQKISVWHFKFLMCALLLISLAILFQFKSKNFQSFFSACRILTFALQKKMFFIRTAIKY